MQPRPSRHKPTLCCLPAVTPANAPTAHPASSRKKRHNDDQRGESTHNATSFRRFSWRASTTWRREVPVMCRRGSRPALPPLHETNSAQDGCDQATDFSRPVTGQLCPGRLYQYVKLKLSSYVVAIVGILADKLACVPTAQKPQGRGLSLSAVR